MNVLELKHVSKAFGNHKILDDLSFEVSEHSIYGFIGRLNYVFYLLADVHN